MPRAALVVGVLALVVASGCLTTTPADATVDEPSAEPTDAPYELRQPDVEDARNPWGVSEIDVVVDDEASMDRSVVPEVMKATRYWEEAIDPGQRYAPEFDVVAHSDSPEVRVEVVRTVEDCGVHEDSVGLGCAPVIPTNATVTEEPVTVQVRAGHSPETTLAILKHEFGHVLGYRHGEGPGDVMARNLSAAAPGEVTDAFERDYPWASASLSVAVVGDGGVDADVRDRVAQATAYYERGADGTVSAPPAFELVADRADADVVVEVSDNETVACSGVSPANSCAEWTGPDVDGDGDEEYYTGGRIVVGSGERNRVGWHVGYWLGRTLWTNGVPEPFLTPDQRPVEHW
ncbi:hypothetical protein [Halobacterium yunchengense]|uniref:hypothetical protein n=1 Tax=Halobacterium yunchengense TaxID=3108497 RepID=UPI003008BE5F